MKQNIYLSEFNKTKSNSSPAQKNWIDGQISDALLPCGTENAQILFSPTNKII